VLKHFDVKRSSSVYQHIRLRSFGTQRLPDGVNEATNCRVPGVHWSDSLSRLGIGCRDNAGDGIAANGLITETAKIFSVNPIH